MNVGEVFRGRLIKWGLMYVRLNGDPFVEVDCFKYLGSQVTADGGCERDDVVQSMNKGYKTC